MAGDDGVLLESTQQSYGTETFERKAKKSKLQEWRKKVSDFMHQNHYFHIAVTVFIFIDIMSIITILILEVLQRDRYCILHFNYTRNTEVNHLEKYESYKKVEHILDYVSLSILALFMLENAVKIFASGSEFFKQKFEVFDAIVVTVAFFLDIFLDKDAVTNTVGLLMLLRLWRVVHIVTSITETMKMNEEHTVDELKKQVKDLQEEVDQLNKLKV